MEEGAKCPVCLQVFPEDEAVAFALHVVDCTAPTGRLDGASTAERVPVSTARSCPMCHHVYGERMRPHEMEFHEIECARVNPKATDSSTNGKDVGAASAKAGKRSRESEDGLDAATANGTEHRPVTLFPSFCGLCNGGGRSLLQCAGSCARAFHSACVEQLHVIQNATLHTSASYTPSSSVRGNKSAQKSWTCGECMRGLHVCQSCGFLGKDARDLLKCSLDDCGFYFHPTCLPPAASQQSALVCPRHTCGRCHTIETDMRKCQSCTQCVVMTHRQCPTAQESSTSNLMAGDEHFFTCSKHTGKAATASPAMKIRLAQGDLVLVLEYDNVVLPESAKSAAPQAFNQWGVVLNAEDIDRSNQQLSVSLFSNGSVIPVGNRYVTFLASMNAFYSPEVMLRTSVKWHALTEWNLRQLEPGNTDTPAAVALATCQAFRARTEALLLTLPQLQDDATQGVSFGQQHAATMRPFGATEAPTYVFLDTRGGPRSSVNALAQLRIGERVENGSEQVQDVEMADAQAPAGSSPDKPADDLPTDNSSPVDGSHQKTALTAAVVSQVVTKIVFDVCSQATKRLTNVAALVNRSCEIKVDQQPLLTSRSPLKASFADAKIDPLKLETSHKPKTEQESMPMELDDDGLKKSEQLLATKRKLDISVSERETPESKRQKATASFSGTLTGSSATVFMTSTSEPSEAMASKQSAFTDKEPQQRRPTRKQRRLASMPPGMLSELERQVALFFEQQSEAQKRATATYSTPMTNSVRPTMVIRRGGARGRELDAASHYLVTQEKRKLMCYLQGVVSQACPHVIAGDCPFVLVDLMTLWDFTSLERMVRTLVSNALPALKLTASPLSAALDKHLQLFACNDDGSFERIAVRGQPQQDWLCFCAGVRHLSAVVNP